jgi:peptidoglycan-associated lipoprotein
MKCLNLLKLVLFGLVLVIGVTSCKKGPIGVTQLPPGQRSGPASPGPSGLIERQPGVNDNPVVTPTPIKPDDPGIPTAPLSGLDGLKQDREFFKASTVYFDFDSAVVKQNERSKAEAVAEHLKRTPTHKIQIEGHCDERGTEEYNRALGERRALAIREYLVLSLGVASDRVYTISYGEDRPAESGHDEPAWKKNRRGEFILYTP